jgi:hypothetical protein
VHAFGDYVAGEIENAAGRTEQAEVHYLAAVAGARASGATFVVGIASVGLVTVRASAVRPAAADQAPDAPPALSPAQRRSGPAIGRREALEVARAALHRHLPA